MSIVRPLALALLAASMPAGAVASGPSLDARIDDIFEPYRHESGLDDVGDWTRPLFSAELTRLVAGWRKTVRPGESGSALEEAGWFCQCQDWDEAGFRFLSRASKARPDGTVQADIRFDIGDGEALRERLIFVLEGERWKVADLFSPTFPKGLKAALLTEIAGASAK